MFFEGVIDEDTKTPLEFLLLTSSTVNIEMNRLVLHQSNLAKSACFEVIDTSILTRATWTIKSRD
jgi:hypothetical protein